MIKRFSQLGMILTLGLMMFLGQSYLFASQAYAQAVLYRSVGLTVSNLNTSSRTVTISGTTATFSGAMPDNVGVGDVLQYQVAGTYNVAMISGRTSSTVYTVQDKVGGTPTAAAAGTAVNVYRAYLYLNYWERQTENYVNSGIHADVDGDVLLPSTDLTSATGDDYIAMIACYNDDIDYVDTNISGWTTSSTNYIKVYTPTTTSEVGTSQRHDGTWGTGYRRTGYLRTSEEYARFEGISAKLSQNYAFMVYGSAGVGEVHISECYGHIGGLYGYDAYYIASVGSMTVKLWNNIGVSDSTNSGSHAFMFNDGSATSYAYNNTGVANEGDAFNRASGTVTLKNNLGYSYGTGASFTGAFTNVDYCASDDATADDQGGSGNRISQTFSFAYEAGDDYHLTPGDGGARDQGTDLSADGNLAFPDDINGYTRPYNGTWDIGAHETVAVSNAITISNLTTTNVGTTGFDASIDFIGDDDADATSTFYYCNETDSPGCNPAAGTSAAMTRAGSTFDVTISGLSSPNDSGDTLNIRVVTSDGDGVTGSPLNSTIDLGVVLYRSVGGTTADLNTDARTVTISGAMATFSGAMPNNVGVGDVLQYQVASTYYVAMISGRTSSTVYTVQDQNGGTPTAATGISVSVYRAHYSLDDWEDQVEGDVNSGIHSSVDEDVLLPSTDLVADHTVVMVACYADGVDPEGNTYISEWKTGFNNYIKIYTPTESTEVGESQRHDGTWGTGYRRTSRLAIYESNVRVEGISVKVGDYYAFFVYAITGEGEVHISHSFGHYTGTGAHDTYYVGTVDKLTVKLWNNIGITDSTDVGSHAFYFYDADASVTAYNNTGVSNAGNSFTFYSAGMVNLKNNLGYNTGTGAAFSGAFTSNEYAASDDDTADDQGGSGNRITQTFSFTDAAGDDYSLTSSDAGARDFGTDLSADGTIAFSDDIQIETRPYNVTWDIGADEYVSAGDSITASNLTTTNVGTTGFDVSIDFIGDDDADASSTFYYCNATDSPGCDPTTGTSAAMARAGSTFDVTISGLSSPNDPGDTLNIRVVTSDGDGVTGSPLNSTVDLGVVLYRSVGGTTADLNTDAQTVTISGTMATFSGAMPDNMGVGDVLQYQVASTYYVAMISGRISSTVYAVQDQIGGTPTAAVAGTAVNVYRAYYSLDDWEDQVEGDVNSGIHSSVDEDVLLPSTDLVNDHTIVMVACYADAADPEGAVDVNGWTTGLRNYIKIYTPIETDEVGVSQRHDGTWGNGYHRSNYLRITEENVRIEGLSIKLGSYYNFFIYGSVGTGEIHISECYGHVTGALGYDTYYIGNVGNLTLKMWNNIGITDSTDATSYAFLFNDGDVTFYVYNNTAISNAGNAFHRSNGTVYMKNNLGYSSSASAFAGTYSSVDYCASDDDTADDWGGSGNRISQTFTFEDAASDNYHIASTDAGALDVGTDLSADGNIAFSKDIDQQDRPYNVTWDIGADEYESLGDAISISNLATSNIGPVGFDASIDFIGDENADAASTLYYCNQTDSPGCDPTTGTSVGMTRAGSSFDVMISGLSAPNDPGDILNIRVVTTDTDGVVGSPLDSTVTLGKVLYRSVGLTTADLNSSSRTVTISGTIATFSGAMPDNVGVGDVLQYQVLGTYYVAMISGRISSTVYTVQDQIGGTPTAAVAGTAVNVYRAHLYLSYWESQTEGNVNSAIHADVDGDVRLPNMDLTANSTVVKVACYADAIDFSAINISGWTTGPNNYIQVYTPTETSEVGTSQRHDGTWGTGYQRTAYIRIYEEYVRLEGISIKQSDYSSFAVYGSTGTGEVHISDSFGQNIGVNNYDVYSVLSVGALTVKIWNNIGISDSTNPGSHAFYFGDADATSYAYNNTGISNAGNAFYREYGTVTLKNNIGYSYGSGGAFNGSITSVDYCASDDDTADDQGGSGNRISQTFSFISESADDYHLSPIDSGARDQGTDLSADTDISFTEDIDGYTRPYNGVWDIGADETVADSNAITISNLTTTNVGPTAFDASIDFTGDDNADATSTFYYCNETDSPGCDPTTGTSVAMTRGGGTFDVTVSGLTSPNDSGDTLNIRVITSDGDGVTGSPLNSTVDLGVILYRSVGWTTADLNTDARTFTISGTTATFSGVMPDNVGVGDVLQYQVVSTYYVAFISGRTSSTVYTVQNQNGGTPTAAVAGTAVNAYRAYYSMDDWEDQVEGDVNSSIHADVDGDVLLPSTDLVNDHTIVMLASYADGEDTEAAVYLNGWTTGPRNYIKIYTPTEASEVGTSQRHDGTWGTGYRRTELFMVYEEYVRLEGLSAKQGNNHIYYIYGTTKKGEVHISHCYGHFTGIDARYVYYTATVNELTLKMWNNIGISDSTNAGAHVYYSPDGDLTLYSYNNTGISNAGNVYYYTLPGSTLKNNIGYAYGAGSAFTGTITSVEYSASNDDTADDYGGSGNRVSQAFTFVDEAGDDYHMASTDSGALDVGTDLSADGNLDFTDDIDGFTRPYNGTWDMGADEYAALGDIITISNLTSTNIAADSFDTSIDYTGDDNSNATSTFYYCNETDSPGCDPTTGTSVVMTRKSTTFEVNITGLLSPQDPGDTLNIRVVTSDGDGVVGSPLNSTVNLGYTVYRSVGAIITDLNTDARTVTISSNTATFSGAMPDNVGVGDVLQYQVVGTYYVAFISGRTSSTVYTIQNQTGGGPTAAVAGTAVSVYRAHASLQNWESQIVGDVNSNIHIDVDEDVLLSGTDLVTSKTVVMVPCYADGEDSDGSVSVNGWTTGSSNFIKIYAPTETSEVGTSQRHDGTWGSGYRRTGQLRIYEEYVRLEGLSLKVSTADGFYIGTSVGEGEIQISHCYGHYTGSSTYRPYYFYTLGAMTVKMWNNIGITDSSNASSAAYYFNDDDIIVYSYNNTAISKNGVGFRAENGVIHFKNCLGYGYGSGAAFSGTVASSEYCSSSDDTANDWGGSNQQINQTYKFMSEVADNYHLTDANPGALNLGKDLSADTNISFSDDIDLESRPLDAEWDIGFDEIMERLAPLKGAVMIVD